LVSAQLYHHTTDAVDDPPYWALAFITLAHNHRRPYASRIDRIRVAFGCKGLPHTDQSRVNENEMQCFPNISNSSRSRLDPLHMFTCFPPKAFERRTAVRNTNQLKVCDKTLANIV
jgi:hypothetical protein